MNEIDMGDDSNITYVHEKEEREGKILPQGGGSVGGQIASSITAQSK